MRITLSNPDDLIQFYIRSNCRQKEVLQLVYQKRLSKEIGQLLFISPHTVTDYLIDLFARAANLSPLGMGRGAHQRVRVLLQPLSETAEQRAASGPLRRESRTTMPGFFLR